MVYNILLWLLLSFAESTAHSCGGPQSKQDGEVLDVPDAHSKNMLQQFMREYNSRTCDDAMLWALYGISVVAKSNNKHKAVIEIAETTCTKKMPSSAKCRFFKGAHKKQCRVLIDLIDPSVQKTRMLCERTKDIEQVSTSSTVYQKYQIKRWLWDPISTSEKVQLDNNEHILMGDDNMQHISRDAIGRQAAEVLNWKQNISRLLLMHFGEVELSSKGGSYEAIVHLAESNCLKERNINVDPYEECKFAYPGISVRCIANLSMYFLINGPVMCRMSDRVPPNRLMRTYHKS
ncbi:hypothetical protein M514_10855 [Trichuris suis]|uniref:Cystatin domain-containing protein n=1 Tax=Trichuris suis TaxID=68888 RepID=A0A085N1C0_9BILA|nr:hypothetical protein M513_10855 [Trichuris suis]KFD63266.1 hypothetical protein M514_10855 [Trichuris suis]KHJ41755.1 hypothetical protein D918_08126 [Trichuris suis]